MIQIQYHRNFLKSYNKRIRSNPKLKSTFEKRVKQFCLKPDHPLLHDHQLIGEKQNFRSFSITGDIRLIYFWINEQTVLFLDIGSHNQVY